MGAIRSIRYDPATTVLGAQTAINLDNIALSETFVGVFVESGSADYGIQLTFDDVNNSDVTPRWFDLKEIPLGSSGTQYATFSFPVRFLRINIATFTGPLELKIAQTADGRL